MREIEATHTVTIDQDGSQVFDFVVDQANEPKWHTDVLRASPAAPQRAGATVTWLVRFMGENQYVGEVTTFEPNQRVLLTTRSGQPPGQSPPPWPPADPADKAKVYAEMGIDVTYHQDGRGVVESRPRVVESSVGEPTRTSTP